MTIPRWYRWQWVIWLFSGLPLQFLMTGFNGLPFFSLPDWPGGDGPSVIEWLFAVPILYHPFLSAPIAAWQSVREALD